MRMSTPDPDDLLTQLQDWERRRRGPIVPSIPAAERFVLFVDMLGFAALTEAYPIDVAMLSARNRPLAATLEMIAATPRNPLTEAFHGFHAAVRWGIDRTNMRRSVTAITFSDSAFIALPSSPTRSASLRIWRDRCSRRGYPSAWGSLTEHSRLCAFAQMLPLTAAIMRQSFWALRWFGRTKRNDVGSRGFGYSCTRPSSRSVPNPGMRKRNRSQESGRLLR
jgi:hypothetical protein